MLLNRLFLPFFLLLFFIFLPFFLLLLFIFLLQHSPSPCWHPQHFSPHGFSRPDRVRRARPPCTTTARGTKTRTTASTTPRWTGGSSCATPGTWSPLSGQKEFRAAGLEGKTYGEKQKGHELILFLRQDYDPAPFFHSPASTAVQLP